MGHMKWIFNMVEDGSFKDFKKEYIKCVLTKKDTFNWKGMNVSKLYGKYVVKYVDDELQKKYDQYVDQQIDAYTENYEY